MKFETLKGKILTSVINCDDEELILITNKGEKYKLYHEQDCCESVTIDEVHGDLNDLIDTPLLLVEEVEYDQDEIPDGCVSKENPDCWTWTFYKLGTIKGSVTIKWYGESNGYYSESVNFCQCED